MNWQDIAIHDDKTIQGFFGPYRWLSNFHICGIQYEGFVYPSTENAYMAAKTFDTQLRIPLQTLAPKEAKQYGKTIPLRKDWEEVKLEIMYQLNKQKFEWNLELRSALLATGDKYIEETNWWKDTFWGVCNGVGENNLGKIIMRIRQELQDKI